LRGIEKGKLPIFEHRLNMKVVRGLKMGYERNHHE
jgi:hypothetical protein